MAIGCRPSAEVTEIRGASGGMLRAHVNPWRLLAPLPFTSRDCASLPGRRLGHTGVGYIQLGGGSCSKPRFFPATADFNALCPVRETGQVGCFALHLPVCKCKEASGFLERKMSWCSHS